MCPLIVTQIVMAPYFPYIRRKGTLQRNTYGHKGYSLGFHGVLDARWLCLCMVGPYVGRYNDLMMIVACGLVERFQEALESVLDGDRNIHIVTDKLCH